MGNGWPTAPLGELLRKNEDVVELAPDKPYRELTVRLWGKGIALRREVMGAEIGSTRRFRVAAGQFILSRIDARHGAFGLIPPDLDSAVVSNDFPAFNLNERKVLPGFLGWLSRTRQFVDLCRAASEGTTNRVRLKEARFLAMQIPLPPLSEQRRIVAKIDRLAEKIEEAWGLRDKSIAAGDALLRSSMRVPFLARDGTWIVTLESVCSLIIDCLHSNPVYSESGIPTIRSPDVGWGTLELAGAKRTSKEEYRRRTRREEPEPGDIVLVREGGGTGKAGIVPNGERCSLGQRVMMVRADQEKIVPKFLLYQWLSPQIQQDQIGARMKGSASPHLNIKALRKFPFVLPLLAEQRHIVAYLDDLQAKVDAIKHLQAKTAAELDALLPSILDKAFKGEL